MQLARNLWPEDISGRDKSLRRKLREAKVAREIEERVPQGQDPRALPQPDRPGQPRLRRRGRLAALLRQVGPRPQRRRGRHARRHPEGAVPLQSAQEPEPQRAAPEHGAQPAARQRPADSGGHRAVEGLPAAALLSLGLQRRRRVLRRVRPPAAGRPLRPGSLPLGLPDLHHARPRHAAGRRAGAGGPARGHRERGGREVHLPDLSPVPGVAGRQPGRRLESHDAVPPGPGGHARGQDRLHPRHGRRPRLRRQQVQPRDPGAAPAGLDLQADRVRGGRRGRLPAVAT